MEVIIIIIIIIKHRIIKQKIILNVI